MIKTILVPVLGNPADTACLDAAFSVARSFAAHIDALHVRVDPVEVAVTMSTEGAGGMLLEGIIDGLTRDADKLEGETKENFLKFCASNGLVVETPPGKAQGNPSAEWHVETGQAARWSAAYGLTADVIVASRGAADDAAIARSTLEALLLETGRPILIPGSVAPPAAIGRHVAVAWKPTPQAARAVALALPFLSRADRVTVLTVEEEEGRRDDAERLRGYFAWHGIEAELRRVAPGSDGAAETLLTAAGAAADLLVMGGYGHTRLREWVFGGFTQRVLADAPLAVLMAH